MTAPISTRDVFISVDVESSGGSPSTGSLVSIGAAHIAGEREDYYILLKPEQSKAWEPEAEKIHGITLIDALQNGVEPKEAMADFARWLDMLKAKYGRRVTFVGWSATFDWQWVNDYFLKYNNGRNPFGVSGMDLKAFYLGKHWPETDRWSDSAKRPVYDRYPVKAPHTHNALDDAVEQAELARRLMEIEEYEGVKALPLDRRKRR